MVALSSLILKRDLINRLEEEMKKMKRNNLGFTLTETLFSAFTFTIVAGGLISTLLAGQQSFQVNENNVNIQSEARKALQFMTRELREAENIMLNGFAGESFYVDFRIPGTPPNYIMYMWHGDIGGDMSNMIHRMDNSGERVLARNITDFTVTDLGNALSIDLTATRIPDVGNPSTITLNGKVALR